MKSGATLRWAAWFGDRDLDLELPDSWEIHTLGPRGGAAMSDDQIRASLRNPIGSAPLRELAGPAGDAVIVVDDLTRPTPTHRVLPPMIEEIVAGGIDHENIRILVGTAAHRPLSRESVVRKVGASIAARYAIVDHDPFGGCDDVGRTQAGTPIHVNRDYLGAGLKTAIGCVLPHGLAGFGGGAKSIVPGVAGIDTIYHNHRHDNALARGLARTDGNALRADLEQAAELAGLDFTVNTVVNSRREIAAIRCGHHRTAHRRAVRDAVRVYGTRVETTYDVAIVSAYPKDSEFCHCDSAMYPLSTTGPRVVGKGGTTVVCSAASEGAGGHQLFGPGGRLGRQARRAVMMRGAGMLYYSPNVSAADVRAWGYDDRNLCSDWSEVVARLDRRHGAACRVAVFPCAAIQLRA